MKDATTATPTSLVIGEPRRRRGGTTELQADRRLQAPLSLLLLLLLLRLMALPMTTTTTTAVMASTLN